MASSVRNMRLTSLDDLFSTEETRQAERQKTGEQVLSVPIDQVHDFANNPYKVRQDAELMDMVDSITRLGVHTPCLARPRKEGGYELLSGHRRKTASILAQKDTLPIIVRDIDDDKRQGARTDLTCSQVGNKLDRRKSSDILAEKSNDSKNQIYRYIRLTELVPQLLQMVDDKAIAFNPAVELSYLPKELQTELLDVMQAEECTPSLSQAQRMKAAAQEGKLDRNGMELVMREEKPQQNNITIKGKKLDKYFPKDFTPAQKEERIIKALDLYCRRLERMKSEHEHER